MNWMHASASCTQHAAMHRQIRTSEMHNNNQSNPEKNTNLAVLVPSSIPIRSIVHSIIIWHLWNHITNRNTRVARESKTWIFKRRKSEKESCDSTIESKFHPCLCLANGTANPTCQYTSKLIYVFLRNACYHPAWNAYAVHERHARKRSWRDIFK